MLVYSSFLFYTFLLILLQSTQSALSLFSHYPYNSFIYIPTILLTVLIFRYLYSLFFFPFISVSQPHSFQG